MSDSDSTNNSEASLVPRQPESPEVVRAVFAPPHYPGAGPAAREPGLRDSFIILHKHKWLILSFLLTVVTVATIASFKMRPVYEAVARVEIEREYPNILPFQSVATEGSSRDLETYIETRSKVLQSETLALATIKSLGLDKHPEFASEDDTGQLQPMTSSAGTVSQRKPAIIEDFLDRLDVSLIRKSRLLEVKFEAHDPELAAQIVNTHLENFIEHNFRTRYEATVQASNWLATQLEGLKIKVEKSEDALVAYERENQIWEIDDRQNITTQKLADLNRELTLAQADRMQKESSYRLARTGNIDAVPAVRDSPMYQNFSGKYAELNDRYTEALAQFGPKYPKVLRLEAQLKELRQLLEREKQNIIARIGSEYRTAGEREKLLALALEKQKAEVNQLAQKLVQYNLLKREAGTNRQLHEGLMQRIKEAGVSAGLRSSNIRVVDPALIPSEPARPQKALNIVLAIFVGLVGGVGLAFIRAYLDNTVRTPDDVEHLTRLPSLAIIPEFATLNGRGRLTSRAKLLKSSTEKMAQPPVELIAHARPQSQISEAFRALRTSLLLSQAEGPPQVILVTSVLPQEGKTTATVNLGVTLAQLGDRTLLLDADLRKPGIGKVLGFSDRKAAGLSSYLAGASSLEEITVHPNIANLAAIPTGPIPPNPAELLSSPRLRDAITALRRDYKFILVDSPPILSATDAVILSVLADCVLLVVRSGETPKEAFTRARDLLAGVRCRLLGVVLNAVDFASPDYYYSYKYYPYSYGQQADASG